MKLPWRKTKFKDGAFWESAVLNNRTYLDLLDRITMLALNRFEYVNLPMTVDQRWIELQLFSKGYCVYFNDEVIGNLCLSCTIGGEMGLYNEPEKRQAFASNGYTRDLTFMDSVLIYENYLRQPGVNTAELFAYRLYMIQRAIDVNVNGQKMPYIIKTTREKQLTAANLMKNIAGNELYVYMSKDFDQDDLGVIPSPVPYVSDKLRALYHDVWNECLTFYGYENSNQGKKDRSVEAEVTSEYGWIEASRNSSLAARKDAVAKINAMFGTNIEVRFRSSLPSIVNMPELKAKEIQAGSGGVDGAGYAEGGGQVGKVYDND